MGCLLVILSLQAAISMLLFGLNPLLIAVSAAALLLMVLLKTALRLTGEWHGYPAGILRIAEKGIQFGSGERKGLMRKWPGAIRVTLTRQAPDVVHLRGNRLLGGIPVGQLFDVHAVLNVEQARGLIERLGAWGLRDVFNER
jgi:hypothetical protein